MVEVLASIHEIFDFSAASEPQRFFDLVDAADVGIDKIRCAASIFDDGKICRTLGSDDHVGGLAGLVDRVFHGLGDIG